MSFDHGTLNVPLSKRGNIDSQIDAWKRDEAAKASDARKSSAAETKVLRAQAKAAFAAASAARFEALATRCGVTVAAIKSKLKSDAHWDPKLVIALLPIA